MPGVRNFSLCSLFIFSICSSAEVARDWSGERGQRSPGVRAAEPEPGAGSEGDLSSLGHQSRNLSEPRDGIFLRKTCTYGDGTYQCALGATCFLRNMKPMDLCNGGMIWACCVPRRIVSQGPSNNVLRKAECGKTYSHESRIIGGESASVDQYPWQVALMQRGLFSRRIYCGGALISERYVLTAAHCVAQISKFRLRVRLGELNSRDSSGWPPREDYEIEGSIMHPNYDPEKYFAYDIALLRLARRVQFKKYVVPICLPQRRARFEGEMATVSGWGTLYNGEKVLPPSLQKVDVQIIDNDVCKSWLSTRHPSAQVLDTMLCAGFEDGGKDACQGDSGGPLILNNEGRAELIGIVSWGFECGKPKSPGVYTRVSDFVDWINENVRENLQLSPSSR